MVTTKDVLQTIFPNEFYSDRRILVNGEEEMEFTSVKDIYPSLKSIEGLRIPVALNPIDAKTRIVEQVSAFMAKVHYFQKGRNITYYIKNRAKAIEDVVSFLTKPEAQPTLIIDDIGSFYAIWKLKKDIPIDCYEMIIKIFDSLKLRAGALVVTPCRVDDYFPLPYVYEDSNGFRQVKGRTEIIRLKRFETYYPYEIPNLMKNQWSSRGCGDISQLIIEEALT